MKKKQPFIEVMSLVAKNWVENSKTRQKIFLRFLVPNVCGQSVIWPTVRKAKVGSKIAISGYSRVVLEFLRAFI